MTREDDDQVHFRPDARLLTMLGEQLIRNDRVALVELIKNSYDADAGSVNVDFVKFSEDFAAGRHSAITITDDGDGMGFEVVRDAWLSPATRVKRDRKRIKPTTRSGRFLQGEKGIGRFAAFKLGSRLRLISREVDSPSETVLTVDLRAQDKEEMGLSGGSQEPVYLDQLPVSLTQREPEFFLGINGTPRHGTRLEVDHLRAAWGIDDVLAAYDDLDRLQPFLWTEEENNDFNVVFLKDGTDQKLDSARTQSLDNLLSRAVLQVKNGVCNVETRSVSFDLGGERVLLDLDSPLVRGLRPFREHFLPKQIKGKEVQPPAFSCGSFHFEFFVFDFTPNAFPEFKLDRDERDQLKQHRIYLYRDNIRVYPYGDPEDDWLQIDVLRGTQSARSMFSNDQTVGYVGITQQGNPQLRDKTSREGLLDLGTATGDFVALIQTVLSYLRSKPYDQYVAAKRRVQEKKLRGRDAIDNQFTRLLDSKEVPDRLRAQLSQLSSSVQNERELGSLQLARTQDLAGVGLSVETASHDLIASGTESLRLGRRVLAALREQGLASEPVFHDATALVQRLEFIESRFRDVQGLFVSTRQKKRPLNVLMYAKRVRSMYLRLHETLNVTFDIDETVSFKADTTEAAIMQCLINLVDNATFWLKLSSIDSPKIKIFSPAPGRLLISDNGPGVADTDLPYIFEPFYSGKGEDGKGLGLFIAREVGARNGFDIDEVSKDALQGVLSGAVFELTFGDSGVSDA